MSSDKNPYPPPPPPEGDPPPAADEPTAAIPPPASASDGATPEPPPPPEAPAASGSGADSVTTDLTERLSALDRLYETQQITATELGEARRRILSGGAAAEDPFGHQTPPPPAAPPRTPARAPAQAGGSSTEKKIAGVPPWAVALGAAVLLIGVVALILAFTLGGDSDNQASGGSGANAASAEYLQGDVKGSLGQLTSSAVAIGKSLARTSEPRDIKALNRAASRQIELVEEARRRLSRVQVTEDYRKAHERLIAASAAQRRYLVQLMRASSGTVNQASLRALDRARKAGADTQTAYRAFFGLVPEATDAITATDLTDTAGVKSAINKTVKARQDAAQAARAAAAARSATPSAPAAPRSYSGGSFQSPTGNLRCQYQGSSIYCTSSNDNFGVTLSEYGSPSTGSYGTASGGQTIPYGSSWSSGAFRCTSESVGFTCYNRSGSGFFFNRDEYRPF